MSTDTLSASLARLGVDDFELPTCADARHNPLDLYKGYIATRLSKLSDVPSETLFASLALASSKNGNNVDLTLPVSPRLGKLPGKPQDVAATWTDGWNATSSDTDLVTVTNTGMFMSFTFEPTKLVKYVVPAVLGSGDRYGTFDEHKGKKACIEFSSPNIAKPFHAGHLRSTIIGAFLSNLYEAMGWEVVRLNYLGDWGKQYGLLAIGYEMYGDDAELEKDAIAHLYDVYVKVNRAAEQEEAEEKTRREEAEAGNLEFTPKETLHDRARAYFRAMENQSQAELDVWKRFRDLSIEKLQATYARLNVKYDHYSGESQVSQERMDEALSILEQKGLVTEDKGAKLVDLTPYSKKLGKAIVQKRDGTTLYLTRDLGEARKRFETYGFDKSIYVVASQQDLHLAQLFKILSLMGYEWADRCSHISFGMVQGMSTRKGTAVFLEGILEEAKQTMHGVMLKNEVKYAQIEDPEYVSDVVGITGVMVQDMSAKRINNYDFSWDRMLSFEGDTGPYMQYAHSRLCSVQRKSGIDEDEVRGEGAVDLSILVEPAALELVRLLMLWPETVRSAYRVQEASTVVTYLFRLCHAISSAYDKLYVANQPEDVARARLALFVACRTVLSNGMRLLGLKPLERM